MNPFIYKVLWFYHNITLLQSSFVPTQLFVFLSSLLCFLSFLSAYLLPSISFLFFKHNTQANKQTNKQLFLIVMSMFF